MTLFPHNELKYYFFGMKIGLANIFHNGFRLGAKKTIGKLIQPINAYTRFPEYYFFEKAIQQHIAALPADQAVKILDVGSPKMLGISLAANTRAEVVLTDISELNVDEYRVLWGTAESKAKGSATFLLQDARAMDFAREEFDVVYSMSVLEHIGGDRGDSTAIREMVRVLKPGGLLVMSVPFGSRYVEQSRIGFAEAVRETKDQEAYFFQRIYDPGAFQERILASAGDLERVSFTTVGRRNKWAHSSFAALGDNGRALLGWCNPLLSSLINVSRPGMDASFHVNYQQVYSQHDLYSDLIVAGFKKKG